MNSSSTIDADRWTVFPLVIKGRLLLSILSFGGLLTLYELTNRLIIFGSFTVDVIRNLVLSSVVLFAIVCLLLQRKISPGYILHIWPYNLFLFWAWVSILWTTELGYTVRDGIKLLYPFLFYLLNRNLLRTDQDRYDLLMLWRSCLTFYSVVSLISSAIGLISMLATGQWVWGDSRLYKFPLAMTEPLASMYVLFEIGGWRRLWKPRWGLVAAMIVYVVLSLTRSYILALFVAIAMIFWLFWRRWSWRLFFVGLGFVIILSFLVVDNPIKRRMFRHPEQVTFISLFETTLTDPGKFFQDDYIQFSARFWMWENLLTEARERRPALIGAGLGSGRPIMVDARIAIGMDVKMASGHGDYVTYMAELGYIGFGLFLLLLFISFLWAFRKARDRHMSSVGRVAAIILCSQIVFLAIAGLVYTSMQFTYDILAMMMALGAVLQSEKISRLQLEKLS